jgi:CRP-like cAMP-binding protein
MYKSKKPKVHLPLATLEKLTGSADGRALVGLGTTVDVSAGRTLSTAGVTPPQFVVVVTGELAVARCGSAPVTLLDGAWFGHEALLALAVVSDTTATTVTPTRLCVFSRREFSTLLGRSSAVRRHIEHCRVHEDRREITRPAPAPKAGRPRLEPTSAA